MKNKELCPKCVGAKVIMEPNNTVGFTYKKCNLCQGDGTVNEKLAQDFELSLNEDNFNDI